MGLICGDYQNFGPFSSTQLEVSTINPSAAPYGPGSAPKIEVHVKNGAFTDYNDPGDFTLVDNSTDVTAAGRTFGRAYSPMSLFYLPIGKPPLQHWVPMNFRSNYYVRVHAIDPNSYCDSEAGATLVVTHY
jgi:hypothetical protein